MKKQSKAERIVFTDWSLDIYVYGIHLFVIHVELLSNYLTLCPVLDNFLLVAALVVIKIFEHSLITIDKFNPIV